MSELKTLKDLQKDYEWKWDTYNALKQEAIKWVKALESQIALANSTPTLREEFGNEANKKDGAITFIIGFFNLTDEDLK